MRATYPRLDRTVAAVATAAVVLAGAAACGGSSSSGGSTASSEPSFCMTDELVAAAKKEGSVSLYNSPTGIDVPIAEGFAQQFGIRVQATRLPSEDLKSRFSAEISANSPTADVIISADDGFFEEALKEGWTAPLADEIPEYPGEFPKTFARDGAAVVLSSPYGFAYNTDKLDDSDVPKEWKGMTDPALRGKIGFADYKETAYYLGFLDFLADQYGEDWLADFGRQNLQIAGGSAQTAQAVAAGEFAIGIPSSGGNVQEPIAQGAPLKLVTPELTTTLPAAMAVNSKARHPEAARLLGCWLISPAGQQVISDERDVLDMYQPEVAKYVVPKIPSAARQAELLKIVGLD